MLFSSNKKRGQELEEFVRTMEARQRRYSSQVAPAPPPPPKEPSDSERIRAFAANLENVLWLQRECETRFCHVEP